MEPQLSVQGKRWRRHLPLIYPGLQPTCNTNRMRDCVKIHKGSGLKEADLMTEYDPM